MDKANKIAKAAMDSLRQQIDDALYSAAYTASAEDEQPPADVRSMLENIERWVRNEKRTSIVFVVDEAHEGLMLKIETPCDGVRVELSPTQAQQVHEHWPLKLTRVIDRHTAEFVPASFIFPEPVMSLLPTPPYYVPSDGSLED